MNKTLSDILNNAEAVKATNNALIDAFKDYVHKLLKYELDYEYVLVDDFRKAMKQNCWRMAIYEARLNSLSDEENFNNFCRYAHLQIEALVSFYNSQQFIDLTAFELAYVKLQADKIEKFLSVEDFTSFKNEYEEIKGGLASTDGEVKSTSEIKLKEFQEKHNGKIDLMLTNTSEFSFFPKKEERERIKAELDFSVMIKNVYKKIDKQYKSLDRVPFGYKLELFAFYNEISKATKNTVLALSEYRNKRLSHAITNTEFLSNPAQQLEKNRNFGAIKDALIEVNKLVKESL